MFVHRNASFAPLVAYCALQVVDSAEILLEKTLRAWNDAPFSSWHTILTGMSSKFQRFTADQWDVFIALCCERGCSLVLFAVGIWQLKNSGDNVKTLSSVVSWMSKLQLKPADAPKSLHLATLATFIFTQSSVQSAATVKLARDFSDAWMKLADDSSGFIFKSKSKFHPSFRLAAKAVGLFAASTRSVALALCV